MKTAKEFLEDKEREIIKTVGLKEWEDNKVYFPYEIINFMEEYTKVTIAAKMPIEICEWEEEKNFEYFATQCGEAYCLIDGTIEENNHKYCPFCGKKIQLKKGDRDENE